MTLPRELLVAISVAVQAAGGDMSDVDDLVGVWRRVVADTDRRASRIRYEALTACCRCADGGAEPADGRCSRCFGVLLPSDPVC